MIDSNYFKTENETKKAEDFLDEKETILWRGIPKKFAYVLGKTMTIMPLALLWLIIDVSILVFMCSVGIPSMIWFFIIPFFALHLTPVWIWLAGMLKAAKETKTIEYVITNKRVIEFRGKTKYIHSQIHLKDLKDAVLKRNVVDKILKVGDIYVKESTTKEIVLSDIPNSEYMHTKILNLCNSRAKKDEFYENHSACEHCGSYYDNKSSKCPNCGAPKHKSKK